MVAVATEHLLAISGMNIALFAGSLYMMALACGLPRGPSAVLASAAAWAQVLVSGADFPVLRAGWMAAAGFGAVAAGRDRRPLNVFCMAFLFVLGANTQAVWNVSFQLSFLSVGSLMVFMPFFTRRPAGIFWAGPLAIFFGTFPAAVYHFGIFSWISWPANFLAVPLFHFGQIAVLFSLLTAFLPPVSKVLGNAAAFFLEAGTEWIRLCARLGGCWTVPRPGPLHVLLYYGTLMALYLGWEKKSKSWQEKQPPERARSWRTR